MPDIPDEAVEAAIFAFHEFDGFKVGTNLRPIARAALTAAYPHLLAYGDFWKNEALEWRAENARLRAQVEEYEAALRTIDRNYGHEFAWHVAHGALSDEGKP